MVGSQVQVLGHMTFVGNNAESHEGGALHIQAYGQIKVYSGSAIDFINNTGRYLLGEISVIDLRYVTKVASCKYIVNVQCV